VAAGKRKVAKHVRLSVSVRPDFVEALGYIAERLQISRSAALEALCGDALRDMAEVLSHVEFSPEGMRVYRGESEKIIEERLREFREVADALLRG
jgi:hypothetical protein